MRRLTLANWILAMTVAADPRAQAQTAEEHTRAKAAAAEGARLYAAGEFAAALARLEEAYGYEHNPRMLFNIAQAQRGLARDLDALIAFERFLAEAPDGAKDAREDAAKAVAELRKRVATVEVTSEVSGATVRVDGRPVGQTPQVRPIRVAPGPHQVVVEKVGHTAFVDRVEVRAGGTVRVRAVLPIEGAAGSAAAASGAVASAPAAAVRATPSAPGLALSHAGQLGAFVRFDVAVTEPGLVLVPGVSFGVGRRFELMAGALMGTYKGLWVGGRGLLREGALKPTVSAGIPLYFVDGKAAGGGQVGVGGQWDLGRAFGLFMEATGAFFPTVDSALGRWWFLPTLGVQGRI
jgi:hypothetical protein